MRIDRGYFIWRDMEGGSKKKLLVRFRSYQKSVKKLEFKHGFSSLFFQSHSKALKNHQKWEKNWRRALFNLHYILTSGTYTYTGSIAIFFYIFYYLRYKIYTTSWALWMLLNLRTILNFPDLWTWNPLYESQTESNHFYCSNIQSLKFDTRVDQKRNCKNVNKSQFTKCVWRQTTKHQVIE